MSSHSVAEAKNRLPELIDLALKGEDVIITRHGHPVVKLNPVSLSPRPVSKEDLDWLDTHRVGKKRRRENAGRLVSRIRDEDWR